MNPESLNEVPLKSSAEILSELFSAFNTRPPNLDKTLEKMHKKHKKSKKKHKHKEKKRKKKLDHKEKKHKKSRHKRSSCSSSSSSDSEMREKNKSHDIYCTKQEKKKSVNENVLKSVSIIKVKKEHDNYLIDDSSLLTFNTESKQKSICVSGNEEVRAIETVENNEKTSKTEDGEITETDSDVKSIEILNDFILDEQKNSNEEFMRREKKRKYLSSRHIDPKKKQKDDTEKSKYFNDVEKYLRKSKCNYYPKIWRSKSKVRLISKERPSASSSHRSRRKSRDRSKDRYRTLSKDSSYSKDKSRSRDRSRSRLKSYSYHKESKDHIKSIVSASIDKKKLLEIARKNAINMLKSGTLPDALTLGPQAQEKVIAAIKAGGKTVEELTDFCKNLSKKEALGELSSVSSAEENINSDDENGIEKAFHHPFQIKDKPSSIVMNIKVTMFYYC